MMARVTVLPSTTETFKKGEEVAMRINNAFLSGAILAVGGLLVAPAVRAEQLPTSCTAGVWTVTLTAPPSVVSSTNCPSGSCVTATYQVMGSVKPDHVAGLMPLGLSTVTGSPLSGNQVYNPGVGDPVFNLGAGDKSREAFKVNPTGSVVNYTVWVDGNSFGLGMVPVKIKKGGSSSSSSHIAPANHSSSPVEGACALAGPAQVGDDPLATTTPDLEEVLGGKCKVHVHKDPQGQPIVTLVTDDSDPNCVLSPPIPISSVTIQVGDDAAGQVELSEALTLLVGNGTCAYKQYYPTHGPLVKVCW
jgi:hypothetical protein